jgi:hypothetical protein
MEFGNTFIILFGFKIFEPTVILTNLVIFLFSLYYYRKLRHFKNDYARRSRLFIICTGISSCFASIDHGAEYQLGELFFRIILFISHSFNLIALYFCFSSAYTLATFSKMPNKNVYNAGLILAFLLLSFTLFNQSFVTIKISAGTVLMYSLISHYSGYRKGIKGSGVFVAGVLIAFLSIVVHTLRIAISDWFNHKDIAHIIIAISVAFMCTGVKIISQKLYSENTTG